MSNAAMTVLVFLICAAVGASAMAPALRWSRPPRPTLTTEPHPVNTVAIGTVQSVADLVVVEVESVTGQTFVGRLRYQASDAATAALRPGVVLLVAFNPDAREQLSLADDMDVARAAFDQMLVRKGLVTRDQLDLMVRRPDGGQFPAHQRTLIPESALEHVAPGSLIDTYYRRGDESAVAVCVSPG